MFWIVGGALLGAEASMCSLIILFCVSVTYVLPKQQGARATVAQAEG